MASSSWLRAVLVTDQLFNKQQYYQGKVKGGSVIEFARAKRKISTLNSTHLQISLWKNYTNVSIKVICCLKGIKVLTLIFIKKYLIPI